jgi:hypothetical protein
MNRRSARVTWLLLLGSAVGCSASNAGIEVDAGSGSETSKGEDSNAGADADGGQGAGSDASGRYKDASVEGSTSPDAAQADGSSSHVEVDASAACVTYCACMAKNCSSEVFPNGCLSACATQTNWDLECRAAMCSLVPSEPANDHCTHAFGMDECLDK